MMNYDRLAVAITAHQNKEKYQSIDEAKSRCSSDYTETEIRESKNWVSGSTCGKRVLQDSESIFGSFSKKKILCHCGSIADIDLSIVRLKSRLGKEIECIACRNQRIAREIESLEAHFSGQNDEHW